MAQSSLNQVNLSGNLTRDAEVKTFENGGSVLNFSLAVNDSYRTKSGEQKDNVLFVNCSIYGSRAEGKLVEYLTKGTGVIITGKLVNNTYTNKNGVEVREFRVTVQNLYFTGSVQSKSEPQVDKPEDQMRVDDEEFLPF